MQVSHPIAPWNGIPAEDVCFVTDEFGVQQGAGYVIYQLQPHLYPDRPVNIYLQMDGALSARYMLFGALIARARQLRDQNPDLPARVYACIRPEDEEALAFYRHSGMQCDGREVLYQLVMPYSDGRLPMGCAAEDTPLGSPDELNSFLSRLRENDISHLDQPFLMTLMYTPHFHATGLFSSDGQLMGEAVVAGSGSSAELLAIYTAPGWRRQGMATALLRHLMSRLAAEGVTLFSARFVTRSLPQAALVRRFSGSELGSSAIFPEMYL